MPLSKFLPWGLYVGGRHAAENFENLARKKVSYIVSAGTKEIAFPLHFEVLRIRIKDRIGEKLLDQLNEVVSFIDTARNSNEQVLIHCDVGQSRSCGLAVAYAIVREGIPLWISVQELRLMRRAVGRDVKINSSFMNELMHLEEKILGKTSLPDREIRKFLRRIETVLR
ncbi:dual specificity protein phosphatase [Leptolyngbya sp. ST-U4]|uniref:dual specificity protein phosphatase family protein n=1 Tax=Leptolyngbya sp. ST-U4 TaxID=2933912 RepID=UPI003297B5A3